MCAHFIEVTADDKVILVLCAHFIEVTADDKVILSRVLTSSAVRHTSCYFVEGSQKQNQQKKVQHRKCVYVGVLYGKGSRMFAGKSLVVA